MVDYDLYYWPVPFRGQFIRALLAVAGKSWEEQDADEIGALMGKAPEEQPIPFMGPPVLVDRASGFALSQMPAIALYVGRTTGLMPASEELQGLTIKVVNDANDVIDELTNQGGREMWTQAKWDEFVPRLKRWMGMWEALGARHGLEADKGFLLGGDAPGVADIVTATLWTTMREHLAAIGPMLDQAAPRTAGSCRRVSALPALVALTEKSRELYGDAYCGGEIEKSLRKVADRTG